MSDGCPEGMYPLDIDYDLNEYESFSELRHDAEKASDVLNLPLGWFFDEVPCFTLVFMMPRKYQKTWGMRTRNFDRAEVQSWLDTWLRGEINRWFGWES